jgi:hypothetical protein
MLHASYITLDLSDNWMANRTYVDTQMPRILSLDYNQRMSRDQYDLPRRMHCAQNDARTIHSAQYLYEDMRYSWKPWSNAGRAAPEVQILRCSLHSSLHAKYTRFHANPLDSH